MSPTPTAHVENVDFVMLLIVGISVILLLGITATMIYFVFKYNRKKGHQPVDIHGSVILETIWIVIPTMLVLGMFYYGFMSYETMRNIPKDAMEIRVTARMWAWEFQYANGKKYDTLYVPVKKHIKLILKSQDVNHSFYIPAFRVKEDVIASKENYLGFKAEKIGNYDIACAEYCGLNHSMMYSKVKVVSAKDFEEWLENKSDSTNSKNISTVK